MKKEYMKPEAEKVEFNYSDSIVASGGTFQDHNGYVWTYIHTPMPGCTGAFWEDGRTNCGENGWFQSNPQNGRCENNMPKN